MNYARIFHNALHAKPGPKIELTTDHPGSSYGIPVILIDGTAYGPEDTLPSQFQGHGPTAAHWVSAEAVSGRQDLHLAKLFCGQNPSGAQVPSDIEEDSTIVERFKLPKPNKSKNWEWDKWSDAWRNRRTGERVKVY